MFIFDFTIPLNLVSEGLRREEVHYSDASVSKNALTNQGITFVARGWAAAL